SMLLAALFIGAYFSFTATSLYKSTAIMKIEPQNPSVTGVGEIQRPSEGGANDYYQTQYVLLESRALAADVITSLRLKSNKAFTSASVTSSSIISRVQSWMFGQIGWAISLIQSLQKEQAKPAQNRNVAVNASGKQEIAPQIPVVEPWLIGRYNSFLQVQPLKGTRLVKISFM